MRAVVVISVFIVLVAVLFSASLLWVYYPSSPGEFASYSFSENQSNGGLQFYPTMRYKDSVISYSFESACGEQKKTDVVGAFSLLSERTSLEFRELSRGGEISFLCSKLAPEASQPRHFVAGEGGPREIVNTTQFAVILSGRVSLFRTDSCDEPVIALHEILHALGFDHQQDKMSVLYPVTDCKQELKEEIVQEINRLYAFPSEPDLVIEEVSANKTGRYISFIVSVGNQGLQDASPATLELIVRGEMIKEFTLGSLALGTKKHLTVQNVRIPSDTTHIAFKISSSGSELSSSNNQVSLSLA
ncbi:MAG TPA: matrixin family metalloprotease [Candidatus Nanoarchaeia archaeon]|nr:matrixin family metalloprotease [Candidatus Nanoarchaeia archaeon]